VRDTSAISNDLHAVEKWIARLRKAHGKDAILGACYEAGPCGFGLARRLRQRGALELAGFFLCVARSAFNNRRPTFLRLTG